ncbi:MAG: hypothetical protein AAB426_13900 [Myxococcota bacterium]
MNNITFFCFEKDAATTHVTDPVGYLCTVHVAAIDSVGGFDAIIVDGELRDLCVEESLTYVRKVLVFDNASTSSRGKDLLMETGWHCRVEQWVPGHPRPDYADTWYWARPEFEAGYKGLPPSPHEALAW